MHLLLIAFYLSVLTFYVGVLIYALPIPIAGLKRWGPRLINDAFFVAALSSTIKLVLDFANFLLHILGGGWETFLRLIRGYVLYKSGIVLYLSIIRDALRVIPGAAKILGIGVDVVTLSLYATLLIYFLALLVYYNIGFLVSLGLALMAIPFRIARNAGAYALSFALVFYTALPLFPAFMSSLMLPLSSKTLDLTVVYGDVYTFYGHRITEGFVGLKADDKYIGPSKLALDGRMALLIPKEYLSRPTSLVFDASSHRFYTNVSNVVLADVCRHTMTAFMCRIDIVVKGVLFYSKGLTLHMRPMPSNVELISLENNSIELSVLVDEDAELYISAVNAYTISELAIDNTALENVDQYKSYTWVWYNVPGRTYVISIPAGKHTVRVKLTISSADKLEPETEHLYPASLYQDTISSLGEFVDALVYSAYADIIASILYLSLALSISYGLSRLLGGTYRLRFVP